MEIYPDLKTSPELTSPPHQRHSLLSEPILGLTEFSAKLLHDLYFARYQKMVIRKPF
jgi:hypothetical protein